MANKGKNEGTNPTLEQAGTDLAQGTQNLLEQMQQWGFVSLRAQQLLLLELRGVRGVGGEELTCLAHRRNEACIVVALSRHKSTTFWGVEPTPLRLRRCSLPTGPTRQPGRRRALRSAPILPHLILPLSLRRR